MPKKGTPEYDQWLKEYQAKRPKKQEPVQASLQMPLPEPAKKPEKTYGKDSVFNVHSKSQNKEVKVRVIQFDHTKNKYFVQREDNKYLFYKHEDLIPIAPPKGKPAIEVPPNSESAKIEAAAKASTFEIMSNGLHVNPAILDGLRAEFQKRQAAVYETIKTLAGEDFNPMHPKQTANILYNKLKIPPVNGDSSATDADTMAFLTKKGYGIAGKISEYRSLNRMINYTLSLPEMQSEDGRVRNNLAPNAVSGRFTASGILKKATISVPDDFKPENRVYSKEELFDLNIVSPCNG